MARATVVVAPCTSRRGGSSGAGLPSRDLPVRPACLGRGQHPEVHRRGAVYLRSKVSATCSKDIGCTRGPLLWKAPARHWVGS
jgi:hypothetical protein